jgi:hypothetical protein
VTFKRNEKRLALVALARHLGLFDQGGRAEANNALPNL